jgi:hypothetical protein
LQVVLAPRIALQWLRGFGKQKVACEECDFGYPSEFRSLELSSPSRRIFIDSHSLPPLLSPNSFLHKRHDKLMFLL